jgi:23S rRNA (pseudouridine1915-N3)-methyltransferase
MIKIIAVGKVKEGFFREAIYEYFKRLKRVEIVEVKDDSGILKALEKFDGFKVALSEEGKQFSSVGFTDFVKKDKVCFIIGGEDGLSKDVKDKCKFILSLSSMTFNHEMCRLFLVEQIYRAQSILDGKKYHRE